MSMNKTAAVAGQEDDGFAKLAAEQVIVSEKLCALIAIPAGARVLDVGAPMGHSTLQAAVAATRRRAKVTAIHMKEPVLRRARAYAEIAAVGGVEFMQADAAAMPFADASFDVVLSTFGLVFLPDQEAAAKELARVVRPGGIIALTAFSRQSLASRMYDAFGTVFPDAPRPKRHHYEWSDGERAGHLLGSYFKDVRVQIDSYDSCFLSPEEAFDVTSNWNPNTAQLRARSTPHQWKQLREAFIANARSVNRATDGTYMGRMEYGVITGVRAV